jgi:hypothetical protein
MPIYEEQGQAPAGPPPAEPMAAPPAGGAPPMDQAGASPDDVMAAQDQQRQAQIEAIAASAPMPEKPYTVKAIDKMVTALNDFVTTVDPNVPPVEFIAPEGEKKLDGPLPAEVFVPFVVTMAFVDQMPEESYKKYIMQPDELVSDTALKKASANLGRMKKDKALIEDMQTLGQGPAPEEEEEAPEMTEEEMATGRPPGDFDQEDEEIMAMM